MTAISFNDLSGANADLCKAQHILNRSAITAVGADYRMSDLLRAGLSRRSAQNYLANRVPANEVVLTGSNEPDAKPSEMDVVTVVAANEAVEDFEDYSFYARACSLSLPVPHEATWLTYARNQHIDMVRPILARFYVPSPASPMMVVGTYANDARKIIASSRYSSRFPDATALFILGDEVALKRPIPLGYRAVMGTRSYYYCDLLRADVLKGTVTISG